MLSESCQELCLMLKLKIIYHIIQLQLIFMSLSFIFILHYFLVNRAIEKNSKHSLTLSINSCCGKVGQPLWRHPAGRRVLST